jgi:hypothetical protein|tara:strand:+ start:3382 stop:3864 length:483 start_codon:yes stop_codon:yes gene_type:complete
MSFSFDQLNLSGVQISSGSNTLKPGRYHCEVTDAALRDTRTGGKQIEVSLNDLAGGGTIRVWLNVHLPSSAEATRIGREQLKAMLTFGGHATPDNPSDISSLKGLKPGVRVVHDSYEKDGETRSGSTVKGFFDPAEIGGSSGASKNQSAPKVDMDDEIPF